MRKLAAIPKHILLILLCLFSLFPIYWMVVSSFKPLPEILNSSLLVRHATLSNYVEAFHSIPVLRMTLNTLLIAFSEAAAQLLVAVLAAYAVTRWEFKGHELLLSLLSLTWLVPIQAIMIPNYVTISAMNLRNTIMGVVLPNTASVFAILAIYSAFRSFPKALIEAAVMDSISEPGILFKIILPNIKATVGSIGILLFISGWNEYVWVMIVNSNINQAPIQMGLQSFLTIEGNSWGPLMAAATMSSLPIFIIYLVLQRQIVNTFVRWGIK